MNLESLAMLGEFVGGMAVLVTIGYLAFQSRQNRLLLERSVEHQSAAMLRANIDGWNHMFATILADERSVDVYERMCRGEELDASEHQRARLIALMFFLNLENFILQNEKTPFVEGVEAMIQPAVKYHVDGILSTPMLRAWWDREKIVFSQQFRDYVDKIRNAGG
jgi:hypothetical protein